MRLNIADFKRRINALFKSSFLSAIAGDAANLLI